MGQRMSKVILENEQALLKFGENEFFQYDEKARQKILDAIKLLKDLDYNKRNSQQQTALHLIAQIGETEKPIAFHNLRQLLVQNTNINLQDEFGNTPLHYASAVSNKLSYWDPLLNHLVEYTDDVNLQNQTGDTPLLCASGHSKPDICTIKRLLSRGADPLIKNKYGNTAIDHLFKTSPSATIPGPTNTKFGDLVLSLMNPDQVTRFGTPQTFRHLARMIVDRTGNYEEFLQRFSKHFQTATDSSGRTCFQLMLEKGIPFGLNQTECKKVFEGLLFEQNEYPQILHYLVIAMCNYALFGEQSDEKLDKCYDVAELLQSKGKFDLSETDVNGMTPLDVLWHYGAMYILPFDKLDEISEKLQKMQEVALKKRYSAEKYYRESFALDKQVQTSENLQKYRDNCRQKWNNFERFCKKYGITTTDLYSLGNPFKRFVISHYKDSNFTRTTDMIIELFSSEPLGPVCAPKSSNIQQTVQRFIKKLAEKVSKANPAFRCTPPLVGSSGSGTKTSLPDEFDYQFELDSLKNINLECKKGVVKLLPGPFRPTIKDYTKGDGTLCIDNISEHFRTLILEALEAKSIWKEFPKLRYSGAKKKSRPGLVELCLTWMGSDYSYMEVHVDILPVIKMTKPPPLELVNGSENLQKAFEQLGYIIDLSGSPFISFSRLESHMMSNLDPVRKSAYMILKMLCGGTYRNPSCRKIDGIKDSKIDLDSYILKNCLFYYQDPEQNYSQEILFMKTPGELSLIRKMMAFFIPGNNPLAQESHIAYIMMCMMMEYHKRLNKGWGNTSRIQSYFNDFNQLAIGLGAKPQVEYLAH